MEDIETQKKLFFNSLVTSECFRGDQGISQVGDWQS
jgi:hypothetical protein